MTEIKKEVCRRSSLCIDDGCLRVHYTNEGNLKHLKLLQLSSREKIDLYQLLWSDLARWLEIKRNGYSRVLLSKSPDQGWAQIIKMFFQIKYQLPTLKMYQNEIQNTAAKKIIKIEGKNVFMYFQNTTKYFFPPRKFFKQPFSDILFHLSLHLYTTWENM